MQLRPMRLSRHINGLIIFRALIQTGAADCARLCYNGHMESFCTPADIQIDLETVRQYHQARKAKEHAQREAVRLAWLVQTQEAIQRFAPDFPALERVYLFGSLMQSGRFRADSDIDIAVECRTVEAESAFWRTLERVLQRDIDVRPYVGAIIDAVSWHGEKIYERESHHLDQ